MSSYGNNIVLVATSPFEKPLKAVIHLHFAHRVWNIYTENSKLSVPYSYMPDYKPIYTPVELTLPLISHRPLGTFLQRFLWILVVLGGIFLVF